VLRSSSRDASLCARKVSSNSGISPLELDSHNRGKDVSGLAYSTITFPQFKAKDLVPIPWMVAMALQADGWYLRQDIIWAKPNPMPESVTDRCTKAHEYLFLLTKSPRYYFDAEAIREKTGSEMSWEDYERKTAPGATWPSGGITQYAGTYKPDGGQSHPNGRNKRSVWTIATAPYPEAHFATYPPDLIKPCIIAGTSAKGCCAKCGAPWERIVEKGELLKDDGSPMRLVDPIKRDGSLSAWSRPGGKVETVAPNSHYENKTLGWQPTCECMLQADIQLRGIPIPCTVLDPFAGSGTTGAIAIELGRKAILIELNPKYIKLIEARCNVTPGLALA
jgi:hypothetical protein